MAKKRKNSADKRKLSGSEQKLKATIQQLRASEQQLRAANQQLQASEQQLRAANQQLQAEVAERKKAEEEKDRLVKAIEIAAEAINITDSDIRIIYTNDSMDKLFRYKKGELIGKHISILNAGPPQKARKVPIVVIDAIKKKGVWTDEIRNKRKDGTEFTSLANITGLMDEKGKITNYISVQQDITERKKAKEALRAANQQLQASEQQLRAANQQLQASEQQLRAANQQLQAEVAERKKVEEELQNSYSLTRAVIEATPDIVFVKDLQGHYLLGNSALVKFYDKSSLEEVLGKDDTAFAPPDVAHYLIEFDRGIMTSGQAKTFEEEVPMLGESHIYLTTKAPYRDHRGNVNGLIGIARDITERKKAEEAIQAKNQQLQASEQQLRAANQQLQASEQQLRAANQQLQAEITERKKVEGKIKASLKEKEVLIKEIHHRVKNNMQLISSILNLQSKYVEDEQALAIFKNGQSRIRSMAFVHEKLYESEDLAKIDFAEYVRSITHYLFSLHEISPRIRSNVDIKDILLDVNTAIPCALIINELVSNSLKYAFPEGIEGEICIQLSSDKDGKVTLIVEDNGIGFPKDLDFRKTESLGMQLVIMLVEQLEGTMELDKSKGTRFKITF